MPTTNEIQFDTCADRSKIVSDHPLVCAGTLAKLFAFDGEPTQFWFCYLPRVGCSKRPPGAIKVDVYRSLSYFRPTSIRVEYPDGRMLTTAFFYQMHGVIRRIHDRTDRAKSQWWVMVKYT